MQPSGGEGLSSTDASAQFVPLGWKDIDTFNDKMVMEMINGLSMHSYFAAESNVAWRFVLAGSQLLKAICIEFCGEALQDLFFGVQESNGVKIYRRLMERFFTRNREESNQMYIDYHRRWLDIPWSSSLECFEAHCNFP